MSFRQRTIGKGASDDRNNQDGFDGAQWGAQAALSTLLNAKTSEFGAMLMLGRYKDASELRDTIHTMLDASLDAFEEAIARCASQWGWTMPMELRSLGIDLSTVATGLVLLREHSPQPLVEMETEIKRPKLTGWEQKAASCRPCWRRCTRTGQTGS